MKQPCGFIHHSFPHHVYRLKKSLYGLKQAPKSCFQRFSTFLLSKGFICSKVDSSMFVCHHRSYIFSLLLYVDDMLLSGYNLTLIHKFIATLSTQFAMKDIIDIYYFLGVQLGCASIGPFLSQNKYTSDVLKKIHFHTHKSVHTPCVS